MDIDVELRELTPADAEQFHAFAAHPLVQPTINATQVPTVAEVRTFLTQLAANNDGVRRERAIVVDGKVIGSIGLTLEGSSAELGYVVRPDYWGRGVATQAALLMVRLGFDELGLTRIYAVFSMDNPASVRVVEKAGLRQVDAKTWEIVRSAARG
ncbi:RimJ/RimL family protein N-acetyltransferase [Hamadaea flava]|uniref:GNAT family N-acetyltransferase n=1 Tax=Hamadaea flava TaxID=1742688 RepID=A0ABV8LSD8_9ACTN|nr:GNAT family N-acetyltransferase [Hamadaea flava]MCP2328209.1 RimJ/RimL family protein N-acetyltransferase [Hamadaea flava]